MPSNSKGYKVYIVDAFSERAFKGNNAAVVLVDHTMDGGWMHNMALELGQPATAYVVAEGRGWRVKLYTPKVEIMLCGHATLAAAHVLWESGRVPKTESILFHTGKGDIKAVRTEGEFIEMDYPLQPVEEANLPAQLAGAFPHPPVFVGRSAMDYFVELESPADVKQLKPDLEKVGALDARGLIVTSHSLTPDYDYVTRFFSPQCGIPEDPVTGSAQCTLAPYWSQKTGKQNMVSFQASERGGCIRVRMNGTRVYISGRALTVLEGELKV
jgi:PhzF family phenazine biosynthesis protein